MPGHQSAAAGVAVRDSMPRDVFQLLPWPTGPSADLAPTAPVAFQQQHLVTFHNHGVTGAGSRGWLPQHDGHTQHTALAAGSPTPQAIAVQVSYECGGPKSWPEPWSEGDMGLAKGYGKATVTISTINPAAASRSRKRRSSSKSGLQRLLSIEVEFTRCTALRRRQQQQQGAQAQPEGQDGGYWRPYSPGSEWLMG